MAEQKTNPTYDLEKIYLKDVSFESPESPTIFLQKGFKPEINVDLNIEHRALDAENGFYEVILHTEVNATMEEKTAFLISIQQAGIFRLQNFSEQQLPIMLEVACPNALLPFVRESVCDLASKGGFPQLLLSPVNFESLYQRKNDKQKIAEESEPESAEVQVTH